jgi:hypothetical protein
MAPWRLPSRNLLTRSALRLLIFAIGLSVGLLATAGTATAHVDIEVGDGQYVMEVGFRDEPAYLGQPNALYLSVEEYATGGTEPVNDLAATLEAEVSKDGQTMPLALVPTGEGEYEAPFVPTAVGDYTFRISGTIGEATVDESATSGPNTFNSVEPLTAIEFPLARPDTAALQAEVTEAESAANTARTLAIAGVVAGVLGLILGAVALTRSGRSRTVEATPASPAAPASESPRKLIR